MKKRFKICFLILMFIVGVNYVNASTSYTAITCGNITDIPKKIPDITSSIITIIQVAVPIVLVIFGMLDLFKGITAQKEEELKKGQQMFIKRLIIAAVIFFVVVIVRFLISIVADNKTETNNITGCMGCFLNGNCGKEYTKSYATKTTTNTSTSNKTSTSSKTTTSNKTTTSSKNSKVSQTTVTVKNAAASPSSKTNSKTNNSSKSQGQLSGKKSGSFVKNSSGLNYYLYVPNNPTKNMPLVIFLHGVSEKNNINAVKKLKPVTSVTDGTLSGVEKFIFLAPASPSTGNWHEKSTWGSLISLISEITKEYSINSNRIYLTGFSAGGNAVWCLVDKYPNKFRAAVPVSGYCNYGITASNFKHTPIYAIVGGNESNFINGMKNSVNAVNKAGGKATLKTIPNANHAKTQSSYSTKELYTWLLSQ